MHIFFAQRATKKVRRVSGPRTAGLQDAHRCQYLFLLFWSVALYAGSLRVCFVHSIHPPWIDVLSTRDMVESAHHAAWPLLFIETLDPGAGLRRDGRERQAAAHHLHPTAASGGC